jgi:hypothetical protein
MTSYCLTSSVGEGKGTISQVTGCGGEPRGPDLTSQSCATNYVAGTIVNLTAAPDTDNGWVVSTWEIDSGLVEDLTYLFTTPITGATAVALTMPSFHISVQVIFSHPNVTLTLIPMTVGGCIKLVSPIGAGYDNGCYRSQISQSLPATQVIVGAQADSGYTISEWTINGISSGTTSSTINTSLVTNETSVTVRVWFEAESPCDTYNLNIIVIGNGSVNPPAGDYCVDTVLTLNPIPSYGYFFRGWEYDTLSGMGESGISLIVPMTADRNIKAFFEILPSFTEGEGEGNLFYCPSTTDKNNVVSFNFTNNEGNVSAYDTFHFRVNFYSDSNKTKLLYSAFSLSDSKRWYYKDTFFASLPVTGIFIESYATMNIIYNPEIIPQQITETQREKFIGNNVYEYPLLCGIKYYIDVESYNSITDTFSFVESMFLILDCDDVDSYYWNYNNDDQNWLCSGQGKVDLQVSSSSQSQSIFTDIASNIYGLYQIVWQTRRDGVYEVYGAVWDSELDILYSSGQGRYDELKLRAGYNPIVLTDQANNFYIAGHATEGTIPGNITSDIYINACPFPTNIPTTPEETSTDLFAKLCAPGLTDYLTSSYDQIKARIYQEDIAGSLVINKDKVVPIINKQFIRLDIDGISGAYAVRLRNMDDDDWGGWINIDNNLYYTGEGTPDTTTDNDFITLADISYDAYRIDNSRFIVPWKVNKNNGLRRICCQVLTLYGITNIFCLDLFFNFDIPRPVFKFYSKLTGTGTSAVLENEFPTYNGRYVLSLKDQDKNIQYTNATVYFKAIFSESIYKDESTEPPTAYSDGDLTFNVIQQGINDIWGSSLYRINNKNFYGQFIISPHDGIFNKDGNSFIEIIFPDSNRFVSCLSDASDFYNLMVTDSEAAKYKDLTPEEIYSKNQTDTTRKVLEPIQFEQYYDQDDINFKFGNPKYFKDL